MKVAMKAEIAAKRERNSSLELLRILSMLAILTHHAIYWGIGADGVRPLFTRVVMQTLFMGNLGLNVFVMISGYFIIDTKLSVSRILKTTLPIHVYSIGIFIVANIFHLRDQAFTASEITTALLPIVYKQYWFATEYVVFFCLTPFLKRALESMRDQKAYMTALVIGGFLLTVAAPLFGLPINQYSEIVWFLYLGILASYFRLFPNKFTESFKASLVVFLVTLAAVVAFIVVVDLRAVEDPAAMAMQNKVRGINKLNGFVLSASAFLVFKNLKMKQSKVINRVAASMFGVYLIHENPVLRDYFWRWRSFINPALHIDSMAFCLYLIAAVAFAFVVCASVETGRIWLTNKIMGLFSKKAG